MKLWIDDARDPTSPNQEKWVLPYNELVWAKTFSDALDLITSYNIEEVWFDNDLGDSQDRQGKHLFSLLELRYETGENPTFPIVHVQSSNTSAVKEILGGYRAMVRRNMSKVSEEVETLPDGPRKVALTQAVYDCLRYR